MSRCFPFPPSGYEKQTKSEHTDLLAEILCTNNAVEDARAESRPFEKRKEKKRKKEKRKEKREGKEKKEKDRSKDKHKEKKDRKQKHKDRKEKDKDKDRNKRPYDRLDKQSQSPHGDVPGECSRKIEEIEHSKLKEELDRRIKNEEKMAAHRKVENISVPVEKTIRSIGTANAMVNRRAANDNNFSTSMAVPQRKVDGLDRPTDKFIISAQRGYEGLASATAGQKDRSTSTKLDPVADKYFTSIQRRNEGLVSANVMQKAHSTSNKLPQTNDNVSASTQKRNEGLIFTNAAQKERITSDKLPPKLTSSGQIGNGVSLPTGNSVSLHRDLEGSLSSPPMEIDNHKINKVAYNSNNAAQRTTNGMVQSAQSISVHKQNNSAGPPVKVEDREVNKSTQNHGHMVARKINGIGQLIDKRINRNDEGTKRNERTADDSREERYSDRDHDQKKIKDKDKQKGEEKEKAKIKEKGEKQYKELKVSRDDGKKCQLDSLKPKPLALQIDSANNKLIDGSVKKRKATDANGFLNESSLRPNKVPRTKLSTQLHEENGRTLELSHTAKAFPSLKPEGINNTPSCKTICRKQINGIAEGQPSSADLMQPAAAESRVTSKVHIVPHPDSVYLDQIYSVPKAEEWHEDNDQEWLCSSSHHLQKPKSKPGGDETPQVWSKAVRIESEDLVALPYVVPF